MGQIHVRDTRVANGKGLRKRAKLFQSHFFNYFLQTQKFTYTEITMPLHNVGKLR